MEEDTDAPTAAEAQAQQVRMSAQKARHQGSPHMLPDGTITGLCSLCRHHAALLSQRESVRKSCMALSQPTVKKSMLNVWHQELWEVETWR